MLQYIIGKVRHTCLVVTILLEILEYERYRLLFKKLNSPIDMTQGSPWRGIVMFTIPMLLGNIAQQLYSTVDSIVVGNYVPNVTDDKMGTEALAAIGSVMPILNMLLVLFVGISAGASIMVSQYFGAKDRESLSKTIGNSITATIFACVALVAIALPLIRPLLKVLNTPPEIFEWSAEYLTISIIGIAGLGYYNILSGIIRGLGDSFSALVYLIVATVINIVLDVYFVKELGMEVAGVAWATIIAQAVSAALCFVKLSKMKDYFDFGLKYMKPEMKYIKTVVRLGLPSGLTQAIFSSAMIIVQSLTNQFGAAFIASNVIVMRVDGFAMMPNFSFGMALTTYAGQNVGANRYDRVIKGAKQGTLMALGCSAVITGIILLFGKYLMMMFTSDTEIISMSTFLMRILAVGYIAMAVTQSLSGIMRGAGDTLTPMWISLITSVAIRVPLAYGIAYFTARPEALALGQAAGFMDIDLSLGMKECIQISLLCTWVMGALLTVLFYRIGKWKTKAIKNN